MPYVKEYTIEYCNGFKAEQAIALLQNVGYEIQQKNGNKIVAVRYGDCSKETMILLVSKYNNRVIEGWLEETGFDC